MKRPDPKDLSIQQRLKLIHLTKTELARNPKNLTALVNYGLLLRASDRTKEASTYLARAHKIDRRDLEVLSLLAETYMESHAYPLARKYIRKLCEIAPKNVNYLQFYGEVLLQMEKPNLADEKFEAILKIDPKNSAALKFLGESKNMQGRHDQTEKVHEQIREINELNANSLYQEANTKKNSLDDAIRIDALVEKAIKNDPEKSVLYYTRGKIWNDVKEYDKAFEAYKLANKYSIKSPENPFFFETNNAMDNLTKEFIRQRMPFAVQSNAPIFIFGMPRSGTTLTESICGTHSKINAGGELTFASDMSNAIGLSSPTKEAFRQILSEIPMKQIQHFGQRYLDKTANLRKHTHHFTDKMPHNFVKLGLLKMALPNAKFIHCRRHPIDTCISIFFNSMNEFHNIYKSDLIELGLYYRRYLRLMQHWREHIPDGFHEVFYEDIVANTELNARRMIGYIGLEWEDSMANRQKAQKSVRTLSSWQVRQPVYTSSAGRWKNYEKHLGPLIDTLGPVVEEYENELKALNS